MGTQDYWLGIELLPFERMLKPALFMQLRGGYNAKLSIHAVQSPVTQKVKNIPVHTHRPTST